MPVRAAGRSDKSQSGVAVPKKMPKKRSVNQSLVDFYIRPLWVKFARNIFAEQVIYATSKEWKFTRLEVAVLPLAVSAVVRRMENGAT